MLIARHLCVSGQVQGVFFRAWIRKEAQTLGVNGWVRNCSDGTLEAQLEGEEQALGHLIERFRTGPPAARVEAVRIEEASLAGLGSFEIRH
jgi:acylphosphatase